MIRNAYNGRVSAFSDDAVIIPETRRDCKRSTGKRARKNERERQRREKAAKNGKEGKGERGEKKPTNAETSSARIEENAVLVNA